MNAHALAVVAAILLSLVQGKECLGQEPKVGNADKEQERAVAAIQKVGGTVSVDHPRPGRHCCWGRGRWLS